MDKAEGLHVHSLVPSANRGVGRCAPDAVSQSLGQGWVSEGKSTLPERQLEWEIRSKNRC